MRLLMLSGGGYQKRAFLIADVGGPGQRLYSLPPEFDQRLSKYLNRGDQNPRMPFTLARAPRGPYLLYIVERGVDGPFGNDNRTWVGTASELQGVMGEFLANRGILRVGVRPGDATPSDFVPVRGISAFPAVVGGAAPAPGPDVVGASSAASSSSSSSRAAASAGLGVAVVVGAILLLLLLARGDP